MYSCLTDAILRGDTNASHIGKRIVLPSSFTGGTRYTTQNFLDAMTICMWAGCPDLFITFTCNPNWPEVIRAVQRNHLRPEDRPDIISRVFKIKLGHLMNDLKNGFFGRVIATFYTIEFQKRGLPHAHILLFLHPEDKYPTPQDIDRIICAEIPNKNSNPILYSMVENFMIHGPCGQLNLRSPCMKDGRCTKHFPKSFVTRTTIDEDGFPIYRRQDNGRTIEKNGVRLDNRYVVPYNPQLLMKYQSHINIEWCNQSKSIKYLFKYVNKGHDRVTAALYESNVNSDNTEVVDEIKSYCDCRYISACEAAWRIFGFDIHYRQPPVERLSFHLPNQQLVIYEDQDTIDSIISRPEVTQTMFTAWMEANKEYPEAKELTYVEFPSKFVYKSEIHKWLPRKRGFSLGRLYNVPPSSGELYYERILLNKIKGATCFEDIKKVGSVIYPSFRDACYALGLLDDDKEFIEAIAEASTWGSSSYLRKLFVTMLLSNTLSRPDFVWEKTWKLLSEDILFQRQRELQISGLHLNDEQLKNATLYEIEKQLRSNGKSLKYYPPMPIPDVNIVSDMQNKLIMDQLNYDKAALQVESIELIRSMTPEKRHAFDTIMNCVSGNNSSIFFLNGYGGTGKTYIWKALSSAIRARGEIVLNVASSGIASVLLPGGRTAHSQFNIPLQVTDESTCNIKQGSPLSELIRRTKLIIWDEAPMVKKQCFEAVDRTFRDLLRFDNSNSLEIPFGGKIVVFGGDFRQILPVIPKGTRSDIVFATLNSSYLWDYCQVLTLTRNMRLHSTDPSHDQQELKNFSEWILKVGEGKICEPNDGEAEIEIPEDLLIKDFTDPLESIVSNTYPELMQKFNDPTYLKDRAILAPTLDAVEKINEYILSIIPGEETTFLSSDSICKTNEDNNLNPNLYTPDFLNSIKCSGLPNHKLCLKIGVPVMLLRNIDQSSGLCNGTRLIVTQLGKHIIGATVMTGSNFGQQVFIPRMNLSPSDSRWPFKLQRRQFPLTISYAMTINKSQGQSLSNVGLYLPKPIFTHGQLYVAISRVKSKHGLKILIHDKENKPLKVTNNIVYKEVFQNLS
ncbi:uncharacterized protein G2W53_035844 [Senna tora]|uniref:ATP-dependent DNA helicase n=1 Tax=Senna tora TaxID=362788 RepID=A0A834STV8_9FABA|nr:uncharacterized protein G2W53_035844 [Senna tora]